MGVPEAPGAGPASTRPAIEDDADGLPTYAESLPGAHSDVSRPLAAPDDDHRDADSQSLVSYAESEEQALSLNVIQDGFTTHADVADDGRLHININETSRQIEDALGPALQAQLEAPLAETAPPLPPPYVPPVLGGKGGTPPPPMNVVVHVVGSRGDVQPFVALGKALRSTYGHRVRLATHPTFKAFVEDNGLEFFSIGGDPAELMAFMVKNPGLLPGMQALKAGEIGRRRKGMYDIMNGCWRSCFEAGDGMAPTLDPSGKGKQAEYAMAAPADSEKPFIADAIIANPPSFAHIHIAEKLGLPLHMMFTMPWSPTQFFPHPLTKIQSSNAGANVTNVVSYGMVEMMTWQGLGDVINRFRVKSLDLEPVTNRSGPGLVNRLKVPFTYCWSPALIPKPKDWGPHVSISGFYFLSLASNYTPEADLAAFLEAGPPPVYIGFGSIVVDDPDALTKLIFEAVAKTGQRALVSKGWGGLGGGSAPDGIFMLGNCPHDWLFKKVSCVVHHGGAGTTSAGIALGKPTVVVPFFGDQPFWGSMVHRAGAGPTPIPYKQLTADGLAAAIAVALKPETRQRAEALGVSIAQEQGCEVGAQVFHERLNVDTLRCDMDPMRMAVWRHKGTNRKLSAFSAAVLGNEGLIDVNDLRLFRSREYDIDSGPTEPITSGLFAILGNTAELMHGMVNIPIEVGKAMLKGTDGLRGPLQASPSQSSTAVSEAGMTAGEKPSVSRQASKDSVPLMGDSLAQSPHMEHANTYPMTMADEKLARSETAPSDSSSATSSRPPKPKASNSFAYGFMNELSGNKAMARSMSGDNSSGPSELGNPDFKSRTLASDAAMGGGKALGKMAEIGLRTPLDFSLGIARGFRNAPKLYGDKTVRPTEKVTGFHSGVMVATKEFGLGVYDGVTGLVTQPVQGAKEGGFVGAFKGFGKGIGGFVLKPGAALFGIPGYTFQGVYKEMQKHFGSGLHSYMVAARVAQGFQECAESTEKERQAVIDRWRNKKEAPARTRDVIMARWKSSRAESKAKKDEKARAGRENRFAPPPPSSERLSLAAVDEHFAGHAPPAVSTYTPTASRDPSPPMLDGTARAPAELAPFYQQSAASAEEAAAIPARAPSAAPTDRSGSSLHDEADAARRVRRAAEAEALGRIGGYDPAPAPQPLRDEDDATDIYAPPPPAPGEEEMDEDLRRAIEASQNLSSGTTEPVRNDEEEELARILAESQREHEEAEARRARQEEEMLRLAMQQSLRTG